MGSPRRECVLLLLCLLLAHSRQPFVAEAARSNLASPVSGFAVASPANAQHNQEVVAVVISEQDGVSPQLVATLANVTAACFADKILVVSRTTTDGMAAPPAPTCASPAQLVTSSQHGIAFAGSSADTANKALAAAALLGAQWALVLHEGESLALGGGGGVPVRAALASSVAQVVHVADLSQPPSTQPRFIRLPAAGSFSGVAPPLTLVAPNVAPCPPTSEQEGPRRPRACSALLPGVGTLTGAPPAAVLRDRLSSLKRGLARSAEGPRSGRLWWQVAQAHAALGERAEAADALLESARQAADNETAAWATYQAVQHLDAGGRADEARAAALRGAERYPESADLGWLAALMHYKAGAFGDAIDRARQAVAYSCFPSLDSPPCRAATARPHLHNMRTLFELPHDMIKWSAVKLQQQKEIETEAAAELQLAAQARKEYEAARAAAPPLGAHHAASLPGEEAPSVSGLVKLAVRQVQLLVRRVSGGLREEL